VPESKVGHTSDAPEPEGEPRVQSILVSDKRGRSLVSVYVRADDTFQVVDERGGSRLLLMDTKETEKARMPRAQQRLLFPDQEAV
jgi:hypothetical protein